MRVLSSLDCRRSCPAAPLAPSAKYASPTLLPSASQAFLSEFSASEPVELHILTHPFMETVRDWREHLHKVGAAGAFGGWGTGWVGGMGVWREPCTCRWWVRRVLWGVGHRCTARSRYGTEAR